MIEYTLGVPIKRVGPNTRVGWLGTRFAKFPPYSFIWPYFFHFPPYVFICPYFFITFTQNNHPSTRLFGPNRLIGT